MADVFDNRRTFLTQIVDPIERALYRLAGVEPDIEQKWHEYAIAMVLFGGICMLGSMRCSDWRKRRRSHQLGRRRLTALCSSESY
jgi:K+-transporting ATPase A subunit